MALRHRKAWGLSVAHHCWPCLGLRQPGRFCSSTFAAATSKVGVRWTRRLSASASAAFAGDLAVGDGLLAGLGERDQGDAAEAEFTAASLRGRNGGTFLMTRTANRRVGFVVALLEQ